MADLHRMYETRRHTEADGQGFKSRQKSYAKVNLWIWT